MGSGNRPVSVAERRARLAARHHLAPGTSPVADAVADIIGLHGTDPASVYLSAWARTGADRAAIERALYDEGTLVRMLGMRRTVFVVPTGLVPVIQAACTDQIAEKMRRDLARRIEESVIAADGANWLKEVGEDTVQALAGRGAGGLPASSPGPPRRTRPGRRPPPPGPSWPAAGCTRSAPPRAPTCNGGPAGRPRRSGRRWISWR